jgi:hypothetical protein
MAARKQTHDDMETTDNRQTQRDDGATTDRRQTD